MLLADKRATGGVREIEVANGQIVSQRTPVRSVVGSTEGATINTSRLNLDSNGAFSVASHTAEKSHTHIRDGELHAAHGERGKPSGSLLWKIERASPSAQSISAPTTERLCARKECFTARP